MNGADILDDVYAFLRRFVAYPSDHEAIAHVLWVVHTHLMDAWESTPRLAFLSPEPGSGKTRALEITQLLVPKAVEAVNVTPAYLFRKMGDPEGRPTILYDEIDTVFGPKAKDNEEIRALLNAGHRRGAVAGRCVVKGRTVETEDIPAYCAVALAGLGALPYTILSRSVIVRMKKRAPAEFIEAYRRRVHGHEGLALSDRIATWAAAIFDDVRDAWPEMPDGIEDRDADVWEPLLAVADAAGGKWPESARVTAVTLVTASEAGAPSLGVRLLGDIRGAFAEGEALPTVDLLASLIAMEDAPWGDLRGKPLDPRGLAGILREYAITSTTFRRGEKTAKGYTRDSFLDAWSRYLPLIPIWNEEYTEERGQGPSLPAQEPVTRVTSVTSVADSPPSDLFGYVSPPRVAS